MNPVYTPDRSYAIATGIKTSALISLVPEKRSTSPRVKPDGSSKMALWGDENDFPQKVIADIRKDTELGPMLRKRARLLASGGLVWGLPYSDENGNEVLKPIDGNADLKIRNWLERSNISRYLMETALDLETLYNAFPEFVLSVDRSEIVQLCAQAAENCRWEKQGDDGLVKNCYINANFPDADEKHTLTKKLPVLDPYFDPAENLRQTSSGFNFIYPLSYPTLGSTYYQVADWNGIRESGWLKISQAIPKFKLNLLENQLNIKYHIEISDQYWPLKYPGWKDKLEAEKKKHIDDELKVFSDLMSGVERSGNSLVTAFKTNTEMGKEYSMWKINVIDNKIKQGEFLEEGKDASINKAMAMGLHPALIGAIPNSGMGGAGSNIREAYNLHYFTIRPDQDVLLEPLKVVRDYNGWPKGMVFRFRNSFMTTLDKGKESKTTTE